MHRLAALFGFVLIADSARALVGGAPRAGDEFARAVVAVVDLRRSFCTATAIAPNVVLTAAHCVLPGSTYRLQYRDRNGLRNFADIAVAERHPQFDPAAMRASGASADLALLKLPRPLTPEILVAHLDLTPSAIWQGDHLVVVGAGVTVQGDDASAGINHVANLVAVGPPDDLQIRLADPAANGRRIGVGACEGDSGSPVFQTQIDGVKVIGIVSWATGLSLTPGCGNLTGATRLAPYRDWIDATARSFGVELGN